MDTDRLLLRLLRTFIALAVGLVALPASAAVAADPPCDKTWTGGSGVWSDGAHWTPAGVPSGQVACLPAGSYTVTYAGGVPGLSGLVVGAGATVTTQNDFTSLNVNGEVINRGTIRLVSHTNVFAATVTNDGTIEDTGLIGTTPQVLANTVSNTGTIRANGALQIWGNGTGTFTNLAGGQLISDTIASSLSFWALSAVSFTAGTVTNHGDMPMSTMAFTAGSVTGSGLPVRIVASSLAPNIDLSGTGALAVDLNTGGNLAADIAEDMALTVRSLGGSPLGSSNASLTLTGDRTNHGTLGLSTDGTYALDADIVGANGTQRLTNAGTLTVTKGSGGSRTLQVPLTNASTGTVIVGPGTGFVLRNFNDNLTHIDAGAITIDPGGSMSIDGAQSMTFTQTGGTITSGGGFESGAGTFIHQGGAVSGRVRVAQRRGTPALDPSGPGAATYELARTITLAGDIDAAATIEVIPRDDIGTATLTLSGNRTNAGTLRLTSAGSYARDATVANDGNLRSLTNTGRIEVRAGVGGTRVLAAQLANQAAGTVDVGPGTTLALRDYGQADQHTTAGTIAIDATGSMSVEGLANLSFTQTAGTITTGGGFTQYDGLHQHTAGVVAGRVVMHSVHSQWARLDPSGTGSPTFEIHSAQLVADVAAGTTVDVHGSTAGGYATMELSGDHTNHGTVMLDDADGVGSATRGGVLTNAGTLRVVPGGGRSLASGVINAAGGTALFDGDATVIRNNDGDTPGLMVQGGTVRLAAGLTAWAASSRPAARPRSPAARSSSRATARTWPPTAASTSPAARSRATAR